MTNTYQLITEEFVDDMQAIRSVVATFDDLTKLPKVRIAAANSATLLVAATFEEFVREMAREFARVIVSNTSTFDKLPVKLAATAWKRTMDSLSKITFKSDENNSGIQQIFGTAQARFSVISEFCRGDLTQNIYEDLIHNENNMRPSELNGLFAVSGLSNMCLKMSDKQIVLDTFGEVESGKAHGKLLQNINNFIDRRNSIAHTLRSGRSSSPDQISTDILMLESVGRAMCETLSYGVTVEITPGATRPPTSPNPTHPKPIKHRDLR